MDSDEAHPRAALIRRAGVAMPDTIGPIFLGIVLNYLLWGIQITQSFYYYRSQRKTDSTWLKVAVGLLFISDAVQSISASEAAWHMMVEGWGDPNGILLLQDWGMHILPMMGAFTASIVHVFYAYRIWKMMIPPYSHIFTAIVLSLSCLQLVAGIGCTAFELAAHITLGAFSRIRTWISIWLITASVTDIIIVGLMTGQLSKLQKRNGLISKIMWLTVETGLTTAVVQILDIIIYLIWPLKSYHGVPTAIAPKVYSISMLVIVNSRPLNDAVPPASPFGGDLYIEDTPRANHIDIYTAHTISLNRDYALKSTLGAREGTWHSASDAQAATERAGTTPSSIAKETV